jgi:hypothetical protein
MASSNKNTYCTFLDVITFIMDVSVEKINFAQLANIIVRDSNAIRSYIMQADSIINMYLAEAYPSITSWTTDGWCTPPIIPISPDTGESQNSANSTARLLSVLANATGTDTTETPKSDVWQITTTTSGNSSTGRYALYSYNKGIQGTSKQFDADVTSTDGFITVESANWVSNSTTGTAFNVVLNDQFMFSYETAKQPIWALSVCLSAAYTLNSVYLDSTKSDSPFGSMFFNRVMKTLEMIRDKKLSIETGLAELDILPGTQVQYIINEYGQDSTRYMTDVYNTYRAS